MWDPTFVFVVVRLHAVSALCSWNPSRRSFVARKATFTCSSLFRFFSKCWASRIVVSQETLGVNGSRLVLLRKRIVSLVEGGSETREVVSEPRYHVLPRRGTMCCPGEVPCTQARYRVTWPIIVYSCTQARLLECQGLASLDNCWGSGLCVRPRVRHTSGTRIRHPRQAIASGIYIRHPRQAPALGTRIRHQGS